jgi:hypothetical protein
MDTIDDILLKRQQQAQGAQQFRQQEQLFPYQLGQAQTGLESSRFQLGQERAMFPYKFRSTRAETGLSELGLERGQYEFGEMRAGAGQRAAERELAEARARSQMGFLPQMDTLRSGIMGRMASQLGVSLPQQTKSPEASGAPSYMWNSMQSGLERSGGRSTTPQFTPPSWMNSYQPPQFPRY